MRYVFYAFAALGLLLLWMNTTENGRHAKQVFLQAGSSNGAADQ